jgi:hypothetical protein
MSREEELLNACKEALKVLTPFCHSQLLVIRHIEKVTGLKWEEVRGNLSGNRG